MEAIHYSIFPVDPGAHLFEVTLWIANPAPEGQQLSLPTWIPGSYLIREFARHIDRVSAFSLRKAPGWLMNPASERPHGRRMSLDRRRQKRVKEDLPDQLPAPHPQPVAWGQAQSPGTWGPGVAKAKTGPGEPSLSPIRHPIAGTMGLEAGAKWAGAADLQPATFLPTRLLGATAATLPIRKIDKNTWRCDPLPRRGDGLLLHYQVYAWDLSVRAAHLDSSHGFFNGSSVFLCVRGQENMPCSVDILPPAGAAFADWRVATTLPLMTENRGQEGHDGGSLTLAPSTSRATARNRARREATPSGTSLGLQRGIGQFGRYRAADYDELIDHPVEMGTFQHTSFETRGCLHELAITGKAEVDFDRLIRDLKPICETQIDLFEPKRRRAPVDRYLFMTMAVGDGYGGLEHRASTALICSRQDLPWPGMQGTPDGYQTFLGLASHEYFHTWNVKRIKPACFDPYDLDRESFTALLWVFEGFTSYYDDLMLVRSGVIDQAAYLKLLEQNIQRVADNPGRAIQSIAESSQDAWIKYYRQDENSTNSISSYYVKGGLVALCLDLTIRAKTRSKHSLDDVMRLMWERYGRDFYPAGACGRGIKEDEMPALIKAATGVDLSRQIEAWAYGTAELPLADCLKPFGLRLSQDRGSQPAGAWLGARTAVRDGELTVVSTQRGGPASNAGLSAGDKLIAVDGLRCTEAGLKRLLERRRAGDVIELTGFRRDELFQLTVRLGEPVGPMKLAVGAGSNAARNAWLGQAGRLRRRSR
ncbi:MAG: PDZ domain-containing protein [Lautropia sp.]|nr:PDZ domain-containing protein [Lautropia sp.]